MSEHIFSKEMLEKLKEKAKNMKKDQWLIAFLFGVLLLVIVIPVNENKKSTTTEEATQTDTQIKETTSSTDESDYQAQVEEDLEEILSQLDGAGKVKVMITFADDGETVVDKDTPITSKTTTETDSSGGTRQTTEQESTQSTVLSDDENGNTTPYVIQELAPTVEGVLVVAEGGGNETVADNISDAVLALFPIQSSKVKVVKMNT